MHQQRRATRWRWRSSAASTSPSARSTSASSSASCPHLRPPHLRRPRWPWSWAPSRPSSTASRPASCIWDRLDGDLRRAAHAQLRAHRRRLARPARGLGGEDARATLDRVAELRDEVDGAARRATGSSSTAPAASARSRGRTRSSFGCTGPCLRASGVRLRRAQGHALPRLRPARLRRPGRHATATTSTATSCASRRCSQSDRIIQQALAQMRRAADHRRRPAHRAAAQAAASTTPSRA